MMMGRLLFGVFFVCAAVLLAAASFAADKPAAAPEPAKEISYYKEIRPIFQQHCQGCHQPAKAQGGLVMTDYAYVMKKGDSGEACIVPGKPEESLLFEMILPQDGKPPKMPKDAPPLPEANVELIKKWILQGAKDDTPMSARVVVDQEHPPTYVLPPVITAIDYSSDGSIIAVAGYHETLLYKADGSELVARLIGQSERIQSVVFSPDGKSLAVTGGSPGLLGEVQIWDVTTRKLKLSQMVGYDTIYGASWSPDGTKVAFGCPDNTVRAINSKTGERVLYQGAHSDWVLDTVFSKDGTHVVSVSRDRSMKLTEIATQRFIDNITSITPGALKGGLMALDRHPQKEELLIGGADGVPKIYKMHRTKKREIGDDFNHIHTFEGLPGRIFAAKYSPDGSRIVVGSSLDGKGEVRVYHSATLNRDDAFRALYALPRIFSRGIANPLLLHNFMEGKLVSKLEGQKGAVYALAFRPDGKLIASGGFDGLIRLNDPQTGKLVKEFVPFPITPGGVAQGNTK